MHAAGLQKGDRIMSVNGVEIHEMTRQEAAAALKDALSSSPTKLLKLVVGRRCRPDVRALLLLVHHSAWPTRICCVSGQPCLVYLPTA